MPENKNRNKIWNKILDFYHPKVYNTPIDKFTLLFTSRTNDNWIKSKDIVHLEVLMQVMSPEEAQELLEPHSPILKEVFTTAWQKFVQIPSDLSFPISPRSRASFIYDYICHEAKHQFEGVAGVSVTNYPDFLVLNFHNLLLMRFKMLDDYLHASNILTRRQRVYNDQTKQLELPSIPPRATRVIAGYQLNRAQTDIKDILITCPQENSVVWYFSIFGDGPDTLQEVLPVDEPPMSGPRIRAKNTRKTSNE